MLGENIIWNIFLIFQKKKGLHFIIYMKYQTTYWDEYEKICFGNVSSFNKIIFVEYMEFMIIFWNKNVAKEIFKLYGKKCVKYRGEKCIKSLYSFVKFSTKKKKPLFCTKSTFMKTYLLEACAYTCIQMDLCSLYHKFPKTSNSIILISTRKSWIL